MVPSRPHSSGRSVQVVSGLRTVRLDYVIRFVDISDRYVYIPGTRN